MMLRQQTIVPLLLLGCACASSPKPNAEIVGRTRAPSAVSSLFGDSSVLPLKLEAPFAKMFKEAKKLGPAEEAKFSDFPAKLTTGGVTLSGKLRVRGNTSITDCSFLKLEMELDKSPALPSTPFAEARKFKIGTHCGDSKAPFEHTELSRLKSDVATFTEAFVYRLADTLGMTAPLARYARISYADSGTKKSVERDAFLLETHGQAAKRLGLEKVGESEDGDPDVDLDSVPMENLARLYFFEALIGNDDYSYPLPALNGDFIRRAGETGPSSFWNLKAYRSTDGKSVRIIPYDFDLAVPVRMDPLGWASEDVNRINRFVKLPNNLARSAWLRLQPLRSFFPKALRSQNVQFLAENRAKLFALVESEPLHAENRAALKGYFEGFYQALNEFETVPILLTDGLSWSNLEDPDADGAECLVKGGIPIGMPMREVPIAGTQSKEFKRVEYLDVHAVMRDISSWKACANPGWVGLSARFGLSID